MNISVAGLPVEKLPAAGKRFAAAFGKVVHKAPDPYSVYAAQAAEAMVAAIAASNGTRADVAAKLFRINLTGSILGHVSFNKNGDVTANPVTVYQIRAGKSKTYKVIYPPRSLVKSA